MISLSDIQRIADQCSAETVHPVLREFVTSTITDPASKHDYYYFLHDLARWLNPLVILEIGTELGRGAVALASGAPDSEVITIELGGQIPSTWMQFCGQFPNIKIVSGTDSVRWLLSNRDIQVDLAFLDSGHSRELTTNEFYMLRPLMSRGGVVVMDDVAHDGVRAVWDEIGLPKVILEKPHGPNLFGAVICP